MLPTTTVVVAEARERGIKLTHAELQALYRTAKAFPAEQRRADLPFEVHAIAKVPDVHDLMIEYLGNNPQAGQRADSQAIHAVHRQSSRRGT